MLKENNLVRVLRACETMGNATVICSDKTGTLTQNKMTVVAGILGSREQFNHLLSASDAQVPSTTASGVVERLPPTVTRLLAQSLALNSTAFEEEQSSGREFVGSKTEVALLHFARDFLALQDLAEERANAHIELVFPFESTRKVMGVVYQPAPGHYRLLVKGACEVLLDASTDVISSDLVSEKDAIMACRLDENTRNGIMDVIAAHAGSSLRMIGVAYRDLPCSCLAATDRQRGTPDLNTFLEELTWIGALGIHDPLRPEVPDAIRTCNAAGIQVKMVTGQTSPV